MPDADEEDAFVVVVTQTGSLYLGTKPTDPAALAAAARSRSVYLKTDARSSYGNVLQAINALRSAGVRSVSLLATTQPETSNGPIQVPQGIEVSIVAASSGSPILVQLSGSNPESPLLTIDNQQLPWSSVSNELARRVQTEHRQVAVRSAESLPFADVVRVVDVAVAAGGKVVIAN
jgi:biopolymer transport protein ExbD